MNAPRHPERLLMLATLLREDAAKPTGAKFDLGMWAEPSGKYKAGFEPAALGFTDEEIADVPMHEYRPLPEDKTLPPMSCGTSGCALGLAMISGKFAQFGLSGNFYLTLRIGAPMPMVQLIPQCNGSDGFGAGVELFGISYEDSRYLFDPDCYDGTPREAEGELLVAQRIEDFVEGIVDADQHPDTKYDEDDEDGEDGEDGDND